MMGLMVVEETVRQVEFSGASVIIGVPAFKDAIRRVAELCPTVNKKILIGGSEPGFISMMELLRDCGNLFNENLDVSTKTLSFLSNFLAITTLNNPFIINLCEL